jgi:hypothetical protein
MAILWFNLLSQIDRDSDEFYEQLLIELSNHLEQELPEFIIDAKWINDTTNFYIRGKTTPRSKAWISHAVWKAPNDQSSLVGDITLRLHYRVCKILNVKETDRAALLSWVHMSYQISDYQGLWNEVKFQLK